MSDLRQTSLFDELSLWNCVSLKAFCRKKGLNVTGKKEELIARVFAAKEFDLPDVLTPEEELQSKAKSYTSLLWTKFGKQPDPFTDLDEGWMNEVSGKCFWPPTMYSDICNYFLKFSGSINTTVTQRALNAYKEGKAFSYFDSGWLKEVLYHPVSKENQYCFVKANCTPSQKTLNVPHSIWILLSKKSGEIQSAYCTCFAGLGSTCNHVAAVLFKLDFFWRQGLTNKACTDIPCVWNKYGSERTVLQPVQVEDLDFRKPNCKKVNLNFSNTTTLTSYNHFNHISAFSFKELQSALYDACPNAVIFSNVKKHVLSPQDVVHVTVNTSAIPPLSISLKDVTSRKDILSILSSFREEDVLNIERATKGQSSNESWHIHRLHRVTASISHDVSTRLETLQDPSSKKSKNLNPILKTINRPDKFDYKKIPALKYGIEMEAEARQMYTKLVSNKHKSFAVKEVGLMVMLEHPQYGASPDGIVNCGCCQSGLLEIKCPLTISHTSPSAKNLPYLISNNSIEELSTTSKYYSQLQWQMGVCKQNWCDFFIYTRHGYFLQKILFDKNIFDKLFFNIDHFYMDYVIPDILSIYIQSNEVPMPEVDKEDVCSTSLSEVDPQCFITSRPMSEVRATKKRKINRESCKPVYLCGFCSKLCPFDDKIVSTSDQSVQCESCFTWFHFSCVNFKSIQDGVSEWFCPTCVAND